MRRAMPGGRSARALETTTFTAGLRLSGMAVPMLLDCPMNGPAFFAYGQQQLLAP